MTSFVGLFERFSMLFYRNRPYEEGMMSASNNTQGKRGPTSPVKWETGKVQ